MQFYSYISTPTFFTFFYFHTLPCPSLFYTWLLPLFYLPDSCILSIVYSKTRADVLSCNRVFLCVAVCYCLGNPIAAQKKYIIHLQTDWLNVASNKSGAANVANSKKTRKCLTPFLCSCLPSCHPHLHQMEHQIMILRLPLQSGQRIPS